MATTNFRASLVALCLAIAYCVRVSPNEDMHMLSKDLDEIEDVVDEPVSCKDSDCKFSFRKGCVPSDSEKGVTCTYQYKLGDMLPSSSCRCAGAGVLTARYGSLDDAFAALSSNTESISLDQFTDLMTKYNVPGYTSAFEFNKADENKNGTLSKDEFKQAAEQLMAATTGGNKSLGSSGSRCCCPKKVEQPDEICLDGKHLAHTLSSTSRTDNDVATYQSSVHRDFSGRKCTGSCTDYTEKQFIGVLGQAGSFAGSHQAGAQEYVKFGDGLYLKSTEQTYDSCVKKTCSHHSRRQSYSCGSGKIRRTCYRNVCHSSEHCHASQKFHYCGFANLHTELVRYSKVGTVGSCIPEASLNKKMFVGHRVCPSGTYHRSRKGLALQVCDCRDECP